jgi:hypothetical protein
MQLMVHLFHLSVCVSSLNFISLYSSLSINKTLRTTEKETWLSRTSKETQGYVWKIIANRKLSDLKE